MDIRNQSYKLIHMKTYRIKVVEKETFYLEVQAPSKAEALEEAKSLYLLGDFDRGFEETDYQVRIDGELII